VTGTQRVLQLLTDGRWHSSAEIEKACEVTCHSRLADLRRDGHVIEKRRNSNATGRHMYSWRLVPQSALAEAAAEPVLAEDETRTTPLRDSASASSFSELPAGVPPRRTLSVDDVVNLLAENGCFEVSAEEQLEQLELGVAA
jgi:hypothetical protein